MEDAVLRLLASAIDGMGRNLGTIVMVLVPAWTYRQLSRSAVGAALRDKLKRPGRIPQTAPPVEELRQRITDLEQRASSLRHRDSRSGRGARAPGPSITEPR